MVTNSISPRYVSSLQSPIQDIESVTPTGINSPSVDLPSDQKFSIKDWSPHRFHLSLQQKSFLIESAEDLVKACLGFTNDALKGLRLSAWLLYARELATGTSVKDAGSTQHYLQDAIANTTTRIFDAQHQEICSIQDVNEITLTDPNALREFSGGITLTKTLQVATLSHALKSMVSTFQTYRHLHRTERQIFQTLTKTIAEYKIEKPFNSTASTYPRLHKVAKFSSKIALELSNLIARAYFSGLFVTEGTSIGSKSINNSAMTEITRTVDREDPYIANCTNSNDTSVLDFIGTRITNIVQPVSYLTDIVPLGKTLPYIMVGCIGTRFLAKGVLGSMRHTSLASEVRNCIEEVLCFTEFGLKPTMQAKDFESIASLIHKRLCVLGQPIPHVRFHHDLQKSCQNIFKDQSVTSALKEKYNLLRKERDKKIETFNSAVDLEYAAASTHQQSQLRHYLSEQNGKSKKITFSLTPQQRLLLHHLADKAVDSKKISIQDAIQHLAIKANSSFLYESSRWVENLSNSLARIRGIPGLTSPWEGRPVSAASTRPIQIVSNSTSGNLTAETNGTLFTPASEIDDTIVPLGFIVGLYLLSSLIHLASVKVNHARQDHYQRKELIEIISEEVIIAKKQGFDHQTCCDRTAEAISRYLEQTSGKSIFDDFPDYLKLQKENPEELKIQISQLLNPYFNEKSSNEENSKDDVLISRPLRIPAIQETLGHHVDKIGKFILREVLSTGFLYMLAEDVTILTKNPIRMGTDYQGDLFSSNNSSMPANFNTTSERFIDPEIMRLGKPFTVTPIIIATSIIAGTALLSSHMRHQATQHRMQNILDKSETLTGLLREKLSVI